MNMPYGVPRSSAVGQILEGIESACQGRTLTLSRWQTNSKKHGHIERITWAAHTGSRAARFDLQTGVVAHERLFCREGKTNRCDAYRRLFDLHTAILTGASARV